MNLLISQERWKLRYQVNLKLRIDGATPPVSPEAFRRNLRIISGQPDPLHLLMEPWQADDFKALDLAWLRLAGHAVKPKYKRAYIERPRGHSKTSDMAIQIAWILLFATNSVQGLAAAADRDQAALIWNAIQHVAQLNPKLCEPLEFRRHQVLNPSTGSKLEIISSDVSSSWGALPDFVICDELCHWEKPDLWYSLFSSAAKRRDCVLTVLTNAGVGRGWQWDVREAARKSRHWYFSSLQRPQAAWIDEEWLEEQEALLPKPLFERLWHNIWQHSDGEFVSLEEVEACRDPALCEQQAGQPHRQYFAAIDYAEKHDYSVGVVIHRDGTRLVVDRMDVAVPTPNVPVKVSWIEEWMRRIAANFHRVRFVIDPYQLVGTIQRFENEFDVQRFDFQAGRGNHQLTVNLRKLIVHREIVWYPDCGRISTESGRDDLETELASLLLKQTSSGRCRIDHLRDGTHHDDRSFALGAACLHAVNDGHEREWLEMTPPSAAGDFFW